MKMNKHSLLKKNILLIVVIGILLILSLQIVFATSAKFTEQRKLYFSGSFGDEGSQRYKDAYSDNSDIGLQLCDEGNSVYVGAFYALHLTNGNYEYVLVSSASDTDALSELSINDGDIGFIYNFLLEKEIPLSTEELIKSLIKHRIEIEKKKSAD